MSTFNGKILNIRIFGGSHDDFIGAEIYGLPETETDLTSLEEFCARRKPRGEFSTTRREEDKIDLALIDGGLRIVIKNGDVKSSDYSDLYGKPRPSHADYAAYLKDGTLDFKGGGRFSGRMTAVQCAVGGLCIRALKKFGVKVAAYLSAVGSIEALSYRKRSLSVDEIEKTRGDVIPSLSKTKEIINELTLAKDRGDSVGGRVDLVAEGDIAALGNDCFDSLEGVLSRLLFSIPAVKAVEFGLGTGFCSSLGSDVNDQIFLSGDKVGFFSNNSGGINGGISNGAPVTLSVTFRPTPSIAAEQKTVDLIKKENCVISVGGRHDTCVAIRAVPVVESMVAIGLLDEILWNERNKQNISKQKQ